MVVSEPVNYLRRCFHGRRTRWYRKAREVWEGCSSLVSAAVWWRQTEEDNRRRRRRSLKAELTLQASAFLHVGPAFGFLDSNVLTVGAVFEARLMLNIQVVRLEKLDSAASGSVGYGWTSVVAPPTHCH